MDSKDNPDSELLPGFKDKCLVHQTSGWSSKLHVARSSGEIRLHKLAVRYQKDNLLLQLQKLPYRSSSQFKEVKQGERWTKRKKQTWKVKNSEFHQITPSIQFMTRSRKQNLSGLIGSKLKLDCIIQRYENSIVHLSFGNSDETSSFQMEKSWSRQYSHKNQFAGKLLKNLFAGQTK